MAKSAALSKKSKKRNQCYLDKETRNVVKEMRREPMPNRLRDFDFAEI